MIRLDLVEKWSQLINSTRPIFTWTGDAELGWLAEACQGAKLAIEIGTHFGRSAKTMLLANRNLHLWCIDPWPWDGIQHTAAHFLGKEIEDGRCELVKRTATDARPMLEHLTGKVDFLFIDGDHTFDGIVADIRNYLPLVREGGIICGHDYGNATYPDVARAVKELIPTHHVPTESVWAWVKKNDRLSLGGTVCIRNGTEFDFCWELAVKSLLPVCDEVVLCVATSTDDTEERACELAAANSRIKLVHYEWKDPVGDPDFVMDWTNFAREHLTTDYHFQLDADEVLHESAYPVISGLLEAGGMFSACCLRRNFWGDARTLIPKHTCCADEVLRMAPTRLWLPADVPRPKGQEAMNLHRNEFGIEIFHYGFIRKKEAFFKKERQLQKGFFGSYDPSLDHAEKFDGNWMKTDQFAVWVKDGLVPFIGNHPIIARPWLNERGHDA